MKSEQIKNDALQRTDKVIMLVEDDPDDIFIFQRALQAAHISLPLVILTNGQEALDYLSHSRKYSDQAQYPLPFVVFLDLKLPYIDGFEILTWIRKQPSLESVVVVALSGSDETRDHQKSYTLGARSYVVKPPTAVQLRQFMESMASYGDWPKNI